MRRGGGVVVPAVDGVMGAGEAILEGEKGGYAKTVT